MTRRLPLLCLSLCVSRTRTAIRSSPSSVVMGVQPIVSFLFQKSCLCSSCECVQLALSVSGRDVRGPGSTGLSEPQPARALLARTQPPCAPCSFASRSTSSNISSSLSSSQISFPSRCHVQHGRTSSFLTISNIAKYLCP